MDRILGKCAVLAVFEHALHDLGSHRCPGAVFDQANLVVCEITLGQMMDELAHEREDLGIICRGRKDYLAVTESILNGLCHVTACEVIYHDLGTAFISEHLCESLYCKLCVAVNGSIGDHDAFGLLLVC